MSDITVPTPEENEVTADEAALPESADTDQVVIVEDDEPAKVEYLEFVGTPPYGAEFISSHTVTRRQVRDNWDLSMPKDLEWTKAKGGPHAGRMLVPVSDTTPEVAQGLENDPMFRRVTL